VRLVFYGTPALAVPPLERLRADGRDIDLVVTRRDRPRGRGLATGKSPVREAAESMRIPVATPIRAGAPEEVERLRALAPDLLVVVAYGQILPAPLLAVPRIGAINLHYSLLPRHRGASPIQGALLEGDRETGVSTMWITEGLDEGPVARAQPVAIDPEENAGHLGARLAQVGAQCLAETVADIEAGRMQRTPQDSSRATYAPKIPADAGRLTLDLSPETLARRVRAFTPEPGAYFELERGRLLVLAAAPESSAPGAAAAGPPGDPGTILALDREQGILLALREGLVWLQRVRPSGRRDMPGRDYANGARWKPGDRLPLLPVRA